MPREITHWHMEQLPILKELTQVHMERHPILKGLIPEQLAKPLTLKDY
jgi:hypothetical protein